MSAIEHRAAKGLVPSTLLLGLTVLQPLLVVPVLLNHWGSQRYGIWVLLVSVVTTMQCLDTGYQTYAGNEFNRLYVQSRSALFDYVSGLLRVAYVLGALFLTAGIALYVSGWWAGWLPPGTDVALERDAGWAFLLLIMSWGLQGPVTGLFAKLYAPTGAYARSQWWGVLLRVGTILALLLAAAGSDRLWIAALAVLAVTLVQAAGVIIDAHRRFHDLFDWWKARVWRKGVAALASSLPLIGSNFLDGAMQSAVLVYVGTYHQGSGVALFVTLRTLVNMMTPVANLAVGPIVPDLVRYVVQREGQKLRDLMQVVWLIALGGGGLVLAVLNSMARPLYAVWTRGVIEFDQAVFAALALGALVRLAGFPCTIYLRALNFNVLALAGLGIQGGVLALGAMWLGAAPSLADTVLVIALADLVANCFWPLACVAVHSQRNKLQLLRSILITSALWAAWLALGWYGEATGRLGLLSFAIWQTLGVAGYLLWSWQALSREAKRRLATLTARGAV